MTEAEKYVTNMLDNALHDLQLFCMNHPEYGDLGLETTNKLIQLAGGEQKGQYRCDKADILASMGRTAEAEQEFQALFDEMPGYDFGRYRYALHLRDVERSEEAMSVLRALLARKDELDAQTKRDAADLLEDMENDFP